MTGTVLIIDDEEDLRFFVAAGLSRAGWQVYEAGAVEAALDILARTACDVILLDLRLGRQDGLALLGQIKQGWPEAMVIIITAYASIDSAVEAVRQDAFDYLRKPCSVSDIIAAAGRALAKKAGRPGAEPVEAGPAAGAIHTGALVIEPGTRTVWLAGQAISLTPTEYAVLEILAQTPGQAVSLDELIRQGMGHKSDGFNDQETMRVHVSRLRRKLGSRYILTVRGGYALVNLPAAY